MEFAFDIEVKDIQKTENGYEIETTKGCYETKCIVNAAGVYADVFHNMVSEEKLSITPRRGEYCLMDKKAGSFVSHTIFQLPTAMGKGVLITPTVHGNLLAGPTAENIEDKEGINTTGEGIAKLSQMARLSAENIPLNMVITSFAGLRAAEKAEILSWERSLMRRDFLMQQEFSHRDFPALLPLENIWQTALQRS